MKIVIDVDPDVTYTVERIEEGVSLIMESAFPDVGGFYR